jgi:amino acid adenylation domain-containing protein
MSDRKPEAIYPLSPAQQGILLYLVLAERSDAYFEQISCEIEGDLEPERLRQAWQAVVDRHPALRTFFLWERRERPLQVVTREMEIPFVVEDWSALDEAAQEAAFAALLSRDKERGFDLARPPLLRFFVARLGERRHRFLWSFSHLLIDGWSLSRVMGEAFDNHEKLGRGEMLDKTPSPPYSRYIDWIEKQDKSQAEAFWKESLAGIDGATPLPIDRQPGAAMGSRAARFGTTRYRQAMVPAELGSRIDEMARARQLPPNLVWQAAWGLLLQLYSGEDAVVYGSVVSGRPPRLQGVEQIVGLFINALPVAWRGRPEESVGAALAALNRQMVEQREFEYCQLEEIQRWLGLAHDQALFDTLLIYENYPRQGREAALKLKMGNVVEVTNHALVAYVLPHDGGAVVRLVYDTGRFADADVERMLASYVGLLEQIAARPERPLSSFELLGEEEKAQMLALGRGEKRDWSRRPLPALVAESAAEQGERLAVSQVGSPHRLTYGELDSQAESLARHLAGRGVKRGDKVVVALERSPALIVALLAVGKTGAAYLPVDPAYPAERIHFLLEDSGARLAVTQERLAGKFTSEIDLVLVDAWLADPRVALFAGAAATPDGSEPSGPELGDVAYVIYTSGSTGKPKGVEVEHAQLSHYAQDARIAYGIEAGQRLLQFASIGFDTSAEEIWPALLAGATLVLRSEAMIGSPRFFLEELGRQEIGLLNLPTAYWHELCTELEDGGALPESLHGVIIGGEAAIRQRLASWLDKGGRRVKLYNTYGPTETTIVATRAALEGWPADEAEVPIGKPIANSRAYVVSRRGRLQPPGLPGELWIAGAGVARGYLGRPEATAAVFGEDPFQPGDRLYKTGDLVLMREDGSLYFRGRIDQQVKIRGYRVEPGEIEAVLLRHPLVKDVVVVPSRHGGDLRLVAYLVAADTGVEPPLAALRTLLTAELPEYMVPAAFVFLPILPKTPSGKIDRRALPAPEKAAARIEREFRAPQTPVEELLASIWSELLNQSEISRDDDFFQLGGHSLVVGRLTSRLRKSLKVELPLVTVFEHPRLEALAAKVQELLQKAESGGEQDEVELELPPIEKAPRDGHLPLSYPQERVWLIHQIHPDTIAYNFQATMWFVGNLQPEILAKALTEIVRRHEIFQTRFPAIDGRAAMVIEKPWTVELPVTDLRHLGEEGALKRAEELLAEETAKPFDITQLPLMRWKLLRLADERWTLIQVEHHFIHDGWSLSILMREMTTLYRAYAAGQPSPLPELDIQYADFAAWQRHHISGARVGGLVDWWRKKLEGMPTVLELPFDHPRPAHAAMLGESEYFVLPDELYADLRRFGKDNGFTLYMTMLAAFCAMVSRYTGQDDFGIGAGVANRRQQAQMNLIGMIVNSVVLRCDLRGNPTFAELVRRIRLASIEAYEHQDMPFEQLVNELRPERQVGRNPLFQAMFSFHDAAMPRLDFGPGLVANGLVRSNRSAKLDMNVIVAPQAEQQVGQDAGGRKQQAPVIWEYNRELFDRDTIQRMIGHYLTIAADAIKNPDKRISELAIFEPDQQAVLMELARTPSGSPRGAGLAALFERQAAASPDSVAVEHNDSVLSYAQLDQRSSRLAGLLRRRGVLPGGLVGLCVPRGLDMVVGMLGILKAGGAYVPLDPSYPAERLALMMSDTAMPLVVATRELLGQLPEGTPGLALDAEAETIAGLPADPLGLPVDDDFPAYVIFTSGSTGKPKGVVIPQRAVKRLVIGADFYQAGPDDRFGQVANASFDAVTFEIWAPLLHGGRVVVLDKEQWLSPAGLDAAAAEKGITAMFLTAAYFQQVVETQPSFAPRLRRLLFGGERCEPEAARKALAAGAKGLMNGYGPTECTTFAVCHKLDSLPEDAGSVSIGRPIAGTEAYILDSHGQLVPLGAHGELCLGGEGLADGYHGRPALTAEKFVPHPFAKEPGARLYRTGDLARWLPDGTIDYLGRIDHQVKLRGFRIELGEIENVLARLPGVAGSVALVREDRPGDRRLVAYAVPAPGVELSASALQEELQRRLPNFMVPSAIVLLAELPLNANAKIDRKALPAPESASIASGDALPETATEKALAEIFCEVLGISSVGAGEDFFALGGHSLLATQLVSRIQAGFGLRLGLAQVFEEPNVRGLAGLIERSGGGRDGAGGRGQGAIVARDAEDLVAQAAELDDAGLDALLRSLQEE